MRFALMLALCLLVPASTRANTAPRPLTKAQLPMLLWSRAGSTANLNAWLGGANAPAGLRITHASGQVSGTSGGGAGNTVVTISDGTNTCLVTWTCVSTNIATGASVAASVADGTGTGCTFAAGASLRATVTTAGCTTTQPQIHFNVFAVYR